MVKAFAVIVAALGFLPILTSARACTTGLKYCGYNLLKIGQYYTEITNEIEKYGYTTGALEYSKHSLFSCGEGGVAWIGFLDYCENGCHDGGSGRSDWCN
ncbi:hypothetical protein jhhlp_008474 [Lomentospora prolificans]|uniref:Uncharacterized protein n=1 Tax=Lomentospora prolificans TaxID=41688 RepID=A0A2N3MY57_9PEZI|nr:hypothetical protein jhhlp_008474 [Lomentospora prolificans]